MPALLAQLHPTYRCAICRSLLVMGEPHSHGRSVRAVEEALRLVTTTLPRSQGAQPLTKRYARGTGYMG